MSSPAAGALTDPCGTDGSARIADPSALQLTLRPLQRFLTLPNVCEICINRPGTIYIESAAGWRQEPMPQLDFDWCLRFAKLVAHHSHQRIDASRPLLSAALPGGERVQVVLPPATSAGCVAICIRCPSRRPWSIAELSQRGIFRLASRVADGSDGAGEFEPHDAALRALLARGDLQGFMQRAVLARKNILVSGPTGSGKTTWTRALIREIPADERLVTIEDTPELSLDLHPNHVRLFYSKDDQGLARVSPRQLLECSLRLKPDRILLAELRGEEAFDYLRNVNSGHPGSITSVHATSAELALEQLMLLVKLSPAGRELSRADIKELLDLLIDVVIQFGTLRHERFIRQVWFKPQRLEARA